MSRSRISPRSLLDTAAPTRRWPLALLLALVPACTLTDVTAPDSDDVLVVEGALRTDRDAQTILLHRTVEDAAARPEPGARVTVAVFVPDPATGEPGAEPVGEVAFVETGTDCFEVGDGIDTAEVAVRATCYRSEGEGSWVVPGLTYELRVETERGETVRARTTVPGGASLIDPAAPTFRLTRPGGSVCALPPGTPLTVVWSRTPGAWGYQSEIRVSGLRAALAGRVDPASIPDPLDLTAVSVGSADTTVVLPTDYGVFQRFDIDAELLRAIRDGLPDGVGVDLFAAAADRNYVNGVRGGPFNPSGAVRISSVVGDGVGVFGSLAVDRTLIVVTSQPGVLPSCTARTAF